MHSLIDVVISYSKIASLRAQCAPSYDVMALQTEASHGRNAASTTLDQNSRKASHVSFPGQKPKPDVGNCLLISG